MAGLLALALLLLSCTSAPERIEPGDVAGASQLAHSAAEVLTDLSAYGYAMAGSIDGERQYVVAPERYATLVREATADIQRFTAAALEATINAAGPLRERVVVLADRLIEVAIDANAFVDGGDRAQFAEVVSGVSSAWGELRQLTDEIHIEDQALEAAIQRGSAFVVIAEPRTVHVLTAGPFTSRAEADEAASIIGIGESITDSPPFVIRVGTYAERSEADQALGAVVARGFSGIILEEERLGFSRSGPVPDPELWREPELVIETWANSRRIAVSVDAQWVATGADDGVIAIFSGEGTVRSMPRHSAGIAHLVFSAHDHWLVAGGQTLFTYAFPPGFPVGIATRMPSPASQVLYAPTTHAVPAGHVFVIAARGPTGTTEGGPGEIDARAPDGALLGPPFPIVTPASGAALAVTDAGRLLIATTTRGGTDVEGLWLRQDTQVSGIVRVPGQVQRLAVSGDGALGAVVTDQGVYRFGPSHSDPTSTIERVSDPVRDVAFAADGTLYLMRDRQLVAQNGTGDELWTSPLIDGRELVVASRVLVLDGPGRVLAFDGGPAAETLGVLGNVQDLAASPDGKRVAVLADGYRALIFKLP